MTDLAKALAELEAAAWSRSWSRLKRARREVKRLTGITIHSTFAEEVKHLYD